MAVSSTLNNHQFKGIPKKDPVHDKRKPHFGGQGGSKTMAVSEPSSLPKPPKRHPHRRHAGRRTRRAR